MNKDLILFEEAKKSKVLLNGILTTILSFLMIIIGQLVGGIILALVGGFLVGMDNLMAFMTGLFGTLLSFIFPMLSCFLWVKLVEKRKISTLGFGRDKFLTKFMKGFGIGILMFSLVTLMMYVFGVINLEQGIKVGIKSISTILILIPAWIVQSSTEEIISRGWLMHVIGAKHKPIIGFIVSSVAFGFLHLLNPGVDILSILNIILVGFMFGLYVIYTKDLWGACGIHAAWNFSQGNIFGFSVSGLNANEHSLLKFSTHGSNILTGGPFGPEASIFSTVVLSIAIIILLFKLKKQNISFKSGVSVNEEDISK